MGNLKIINEEKEKKEPELDFYYWNDFDGDYFFKVARKIINRNQEDKTVRYEYWNGKNYVSPKWFEDNNLKVPSIPTFYISDFEKFKKRKNIFIVEGEKDVENLKDLGITATTLASGTNTIPENKLEELDIFKKKTVLLIGDNDVTGRNYINDLAYKLYLSEYPEAIYKADIKDLWEKVPDKGDISDWIKEKEDSGISKKETSLELKKFFEKQSKYLPPEDNNFNYRTAEDMLKLNISPMKWLVKDVIPDQGLIQLAGAPKSGKSTFGLQLAIAISQNDSNFLGQEVKHGNVIYIDFENSDRIIKGRLKKKLSLGSKGLKNLRFITTTQDSVVKTLNEGFIEQIDSKLKELDYNVSLVVIDTLKHIQSSTGKNINLHDTKEIQKLSKYSQEHNIPFLLLNHTPKETSLDGNNQFEKSMGSQSIFGAMDTQMILRQERNDDNSVKCTKLFITGREIEEKAYVLNMVSGEWVSGGTLNEYYDKVKKEKLVASNIGFGIQCLVDRFEEGDRFKGPAKDLIDEIEKIPVVLEKEDKDSKKVSKFIKDNKKDIERLFNCVIEMNRKGDNRFIIEIRKPLNMDEIIESFKKD